MVGNHASRALAHAPNVRRGEYAEDSRPTIPGAVVTGHERGISQSRCGEFSSIPMLLQKMLGIAD
jgi:hypothetical protein